MLSLQMGGVPGGPELIVLGLIFLLMIGVPLVLVVAAVVFGVKILGSDDSGELEDRVDELERELERERAGDGSNGSGERDDA